MDDLHSLVRPLPLLGLNGLMDRASIRHHDDSMAYKTKSAITGRSKRTSDTYSSIHSRTSSTHNRSLIDMTNQTIIYRPTFCRGRPIWLIHKNYREVGKTKYSLLICSHYVYMAYRRQFLTNMLSLCVYSIQTTVPY